MTSKSKEGTVCVYLIDHWPKYSVWLNISANKWEKFPKLFSFILFLVLLLHFFFHFWNLKQAKRIKKKSIFESEHETLISCSSQWSLLFPSPINCNFPCLFVWLFILFMKLLFVVGYWNSTTRVWAVNVKFINIC